MSDLKKEDFNCTSRELAEVHSISICTVNAWVRQGAFPHIEIGGGENKKFRKYHKSCLGMMGKELKSNRENKTFIHPIFTTKTKPTKKEIPVETRYNVLNSKLDRILAILEK